MSPVRASLALAVAVAVTVALLNRIELTTPSFTADFALPELSSHLAPDPRFDQVQVHLFETMSLVDSIAEALGSESVALRVSGAIALVDGRVLAADPAAVRPLLERLHWQDLPLAVVDDRASREGTFPVTEKAPLAWRAQLGMLIAATAVRDAAQAKPSLALGGLAFTVVLIAGFGVRRFRSIAAVDEESPGDVAWSEAQLQVEMDRPDPIPLEEEPVRKAPRLASVRVVLVADHRALQAARIAIGEEHVVGSTRDAFAFAHGWILAVREGSIFELVGELGWDACPVRVFRPGEGLPNGTAWAPRGAIRPGGALDVVDALQLCGPIAHGGGLLEV